MKKATWVVIAIIAAIVVGGGVWWFLTNKATAPSSGAGAGLPTTSSASDLAERAVGDVRSGTVEIDMKNSAYSRKNITIKKGTKVVWINQDSIRHNVVADSNNTNGLPTSNELIGKGETYTFTFNTVGTVAYHCTPHQFMTGTIEVVE